MSKGKVSVIIPAFNSEKYISAAIESVLNQTYDDVECIVVDDGSTDKTAEIAGRYSDRVLVVRQENSERSAARNNGIAHATGEYIAFLDADDYYEREKIADQVELLSSHSSYDAVYSRVRYFHEGEEGKYFTVKRATPSGDILGEILYRNFITVHSPLIRREAVDRIGGFDPAFNRYEDWDFFLRLAIGGSKYGFQDKFHACCRIHEENTVSDRLRMFESKWRVAKKIVNEFGPVLAEREIDCSEFLAFHKADYGRVLILAGDVSRGRTLIREACLSNFPQKWKFLIFSAGAKLIPHNWLDHLFTLQKNFFLYRQ